MKTFLAIAIMSSTLCAEATKQRYDADLFKKDTPAFSLHAGFLFWRAQEGALDYAIKGQNTSTGSTHSDTLYAQGNYENATFDGEPGFRVAASYYRAPKHWEMWAQYTRLTARGSNSVSNSDGYHLAGTWPQLTDSSLVEARSNIHLNYNVADFLVDRIFHPNPHLRLRLLGGATVAWMNQNWNIRYFDGPEVLTRIQNRWDFVGGGIRFGPMVDWYFGYDLYLTGTTTLATLLGSYNNKAKQTQRDDSGYIRDGKYSDVRPAFTVQTIFGLSWQKNFCSSRVELFGGYELNTWFNLQEIYRSTGGSATETKETRVNSSALALQGLTTRLTVDF